MSQLPGTIVNACCHSIFINSTYFYSQKQPGLDNKLYGHVSKRPFPKEVCFIVVFFRGGVSKGF